MAEQHGVSDIL